jgi:hypothetical protein
VHPVLEVVVQELQLLGAVCDWHAAWLYGWEA